MKNETKEVLLFFVKLIALGVAALLLNYIIS